MLRRLALATLISGGMGSVHAQDASPASPTPPAATDAQPAPIATTGTPAPAAPADSPVGTTTQAADAVATPSTGPTTDATANSGSTVNLERVVVTGSRIRSINAVSVSPVTTIGAAELKYQGTTRVEDLLNSLPQTFAGQGSNVSNGSNGTATVDLRGLGANRTLTLIDGKRLQPGDPKGSAAVDLNFIPAAMIERVDVLTGGASAVYGADAVAGVVNFILRKNFSGVRVDVQRSGYQHNNDAGESIQRANAERGFRPPSGSTFDGKGWDVSAIMGVNTDDNRGNITGYATYRNIDAVTQAQRDYSFCSLAVSGQDRFSCGGSSTSFPGRFRSVAGGDNLTLNEATGGTSFRPYTGLTDQFNFNPYNYYQRNDDRYTLGALGRYKFNPAAEAYGQVMFMEDKTDAVIAPTGSFYGVNVFRINTASTGADSNPLLTEQQRMALRALPRLGPMDPGYDPTLQADQVDLLIGRRNIEGLGRSDSLTHQAYRLLGGVRGDITDDINYDVSAQLGVTNLSETYNNEFINSRIVRALDVVTDPATGQPACRSAVNGTDRNCVPYNIFRIGGVTPAALNYLGSSLLSQGRLEERVATGSINGTVPQLRLPTAREGLGFSAGLEYRQEKTGFVYDAAYAAGEGAGMGGSGPKSVPTQGYQAKDVFAEAKLPFLQGLRGAEELSAEVGYRHSTYSLFPATNTYKFGLNYLPVQSLKLRAAFNRAVRVPNVNEYFSPTQVALDGSFDPCAGEHPQFTLAQCSNDPYIKAHPNVYGNIDNDPANQYFGRIGSSFVDNGNKLRAEKADTYTAGFVLTPTAVRGLTFSADYYRIKIQDRLNGYGANSILKACYLTGQLCDLIKRDSAGSLLNETGDGLGYVTDLTLNAGTQVTSGIDINANYRLNPRDLGLQRFNAGTFLIDLVGTRLLKADYAPIPGISAANYECKGLYGLECSGVTGSPFFKWRHKLRLTWNTPLTGVNVSTQWRYFSRVEAEGLTKRVQSVNNLDSHIAAYSYIDLFASAKVLNYTFRLGVNNVFDKSPPILNSSVATNGNSYAQTYDVLGRYLFAGVQLDFGR